MSRRAASEETMATRGAVSSALDGLGTDPVVIVGCSGGPDSLALAAATAWVAARSGARAEAVIVDHGLQPGSDAVADAAAATCDALGLPARVMRVEVGTAGGPEAAARTARQAALAEAAASTGASAVLLGHTLDDQAETVLLRLARGSGARSLSAMSRHAGLWCRPFLGLRRDVVRRAAVEVLVPLERVAWEDPHNADTAYARVRVRALLAGLAADLGPGAVLGLARSADLLRDDADALDVMALEAFAGIVHVDDAAAEADVEDLAALLPALRTRVIRLMALRCGSAVDDLGVEHVRRVDALIVDWRGQGEVALPGGVVAVRACGRLCLRST